MIAETELQALDVRALMPDGALPMRVAPLDPSATLLDSFPAIEACVALHLHRCGGLLFRGFQLPQREDFRAFAARFGQPLANYDFASTPRSEVSRGVYTATEYPAHQRIPLHNEQAYSRHWPMRIWFFCELPAQQEGETPIADSRLIYQRIDPAVREEFASRELLYVRNYGNGLDLPWQQVFGTAEQSVVEAYCRAHDIEWLWKDDGELRTTQRCQAVARHPQTGEWVWFNQAHLFHVSNLEPAVRESLQDAVAPEDLPRNVYFGDGAEIEDSKLEAIRRVLDASTVKFPWQAGDVLMLDNMLCAHARSRFKGPRTVLTAMAGAGSYADIVTGRSRG